MLIYNIYYHFKMREVYLSKKQCDETWSIFPRYVIISRACLYVLEGASFLKYSSTVPQFDFMQDVFWT